MSQRTTPRIELPGGVSLRDPGPDTQYLLRQLGQMTMVMNNIAGQLDIIMRMASGAMSKDEVKAKFEAFDAQLSVSESEANGE